MCHSVLYVPVLYEETVQSRRLDLYGTFVPLEDYSCSTINDCQSWQEGCPQSLSPDMSRILGYIR